MASCSGYSRLHRVTPQDLAELTSPGNVVMSPAQVQHALGSCTYHGLKPQVAAMPMASGPSNTNNGGTHGLKPKVAAMPLGAPMGFPDDPYSHCMDVPAACNSILKTTPAGCDGPADCLMENLSCWNNGAGINHVKHLPCGGGKVYCCRTPQPTPQPQPTPTPSPTNNNGGWPSGWPVNN